MKDFFDERLLLNSPAAERLYHEVEKLPIIDYHCHLNEYELRDNKCFENLGELWLAADHYKWRAMRLCGVDEKYITGDADFHEKYLKYAEIFPLLCGGPLYYWTQLELKLLFGITKPLCADTAEEIWRIAGEALKTLDAHTILKHFRVEYIATTDDPASPLTAHGVCGTAKVCPTFRPDFVLNGDRMALERLSNAVGYPFHTLADVKRALTERLQYFKDKGCGIADHGMDFLPVADCGEEKAHDLFSRRATLTDLEKQQLFSHLLYFMASLYADHQMVMQLHFATFRNVNTSMLDKCGRDAGFDIMRGSVDADRLVLFFDTLTTRGKLPKTVLYSLNPSSVPALATLSGAFKNVRIGAAWWFSDTVLGIRRQLETIAEYAALGTNLGMLTDSRSLSSYVRFDFFRRILADFVGGYVERGEYDEENAKKLMYAVCYGNVKQFLNI